MKKITFLFIIVFPLFANAQLINGDFENIETVNIPGTNDTYEKPVNWCFEYDNPLGVELTSDSYSGNYAIKLWSWYYMQSNEALIYGNSPFDNGFPISDKPIKLKGFYKFINPNIQPNNVPDSAYVNVLLTKYNQPLNTRDTISFTEYNLGEQNSYSPFEIDLNYLNTQNPDSIGIYFRTSYFQGPSDNTAECNYLYLDNLSLEYDPMSVSEHSQSKTIVYPNPTKDDIQIFSEKIIGKINIYTVNGKLIDAHIIQKFEQPISYNMSNLTIGVYFLEILGEDLRKLDKIKIVKQ